MCPPNSKKWGDASPPSPPGFTPMLATHSTVMQWRDLYKIAKRFDLPPPIQAIQSRYATRLEAVAKSAVKISISEASVQLHKRVDSETSSEPKAVNVPISFYSSWKTRGFYSNIGFGAAISTSTKKQLDYEILSRLCERSAVSGQKTKRKISRPIMRSGRASQAELQQKLHGIFPINGARSGRRLWGQAWRGTVGILCLLVMETLRPFST